MQNPITSSPVPSGTNNRAPKMSTDSVTYLALDFQALSTSPHHKLSTSSVTSDETGEYVQIDKEQTRPYKRPYRNGHRCGSPQDPPKMTNYGKNGHPMTSPLLCEFCSEYVCMFCMYGVVTHVCMKCDCKYVTVNK